MGATAQEQGAGYYRVVVRDDGERHVDQDTFVKGEHDLMRCGFLFEGLDRNESETRGR